MNEPHGFLAIKLRDKVGKLFYEVFGIDKKANIGRTVRLWFSFKS